MIEMTDKRRIEFFVVGHPKPQPRQKFRTLLPAGDQLKRMWTWTNDWAEFRKHLVKQTRSAPYRVEGDAAVWKALTQLAWRRAGCCKLHGPIHAEMTFVLERPQAKRWKTKPMPREWDMRKSKPGGDWDNMGKAISDALNALAYEDDSEIVSAYVRKVMADGDEPPHALIVLEELGAYDQTYVSAQIEEPAF